MIIGVLRWGWVEVILRVSLEVILHHLLRHCAAQSAALHAPRCDGWRERHAKQVGGG